MADTKNQPLNRILSHLYPYPLLTTYFPNIHLNVILPYPSESFKWAFLIYFLAKILFVFLVSLILVI
jgi:hypothetical protein